MIKISSSILSADFSCLGDEVKRLCSAGTDYIHVDVMDGHFVPNITIGPDIVKSIKKCSSVPLDVHLMIDDVTKYAEQFIKAGADILTFHFEAIESPTDLIKYIRSLGRIKVGISIVPATRAEVLRDVLDHVDLVLIMTVNPGFAKQSFLHDQLKKISQVREMINAANKQIDLAVDGGINLETAKLCTNAGANVLVSGSYIFADKENKYKNSIDSLKKC